MISRSVSSAGFSLLELILTIVIFGFLMAMMVPFLGPSLTESHLPALRLEKGLDVAACAAELKAVCDQKTDTAGNRELTACVAQLPHSCGNGLMITSPICFSMDMQGPQGTVDSGDCEDFNVQFLPVYPALKVSIANSEQHSQRVTVYFMR